MNDPRYRFTCNLVVEPPKVDRFYMDLRVYSVVPVAAGDAENNSGSLVWRGVYLAMEVGGVAGKG